MANFYATYSASTSGGLPVTAVQGTDPWIVAGQGTAGVAATGVVTIQGIASGVAVPISGSITATNPSVSATGAAIPASATMIGGSDGTNLRAAKVSAGGLVSVDGSAVTQPVSGTVAVSNFPATQPVSGTVAVTQSTSPWVTSGTSTVSGTVAVTQSTSPWIMAGGGTAGTAATGVVTIQGIASGTVVPVTVSTVAPVTTTTAVFQAEGAVGFASVTNSYVTLLTPTAATKMLQMRNNTNAAISVSMDAGSTTNYTLDAGDALSLDLLANSLNMGATAIQVKYAVGAPTSGSFRINAVK
ncbi:MAG: hypothetical protein V4641_09965 [Pseudomonadota bacterium]